MSSTIFSQRNSSPVQTRRTPTRNRDIENNSNNRTLSGKFRNLFRKNHSSLNRTTYNNNNGQLSPTLSSRQRSPSPGLNRASSEEPYLRAPTVHWPFGKKKSKSSQKLQKTTSSRDISNPVYDREYQTSIHGQNFIPRTPSPTRTVLVDRIQSSPSYETTTKGFRDYMVIDHSKPSQQATISDVNIIAPPSYVSDHSRSPSLNRQRLPNTNIEYIYNQNISPTISDNRTISTPVQQRKYGTSSPLTTTQILAESVPLLPQNSFPSAPIYTNTNQWKNTSSSSINKLGMYPTNSSSIDTDIPKLNAPTIPYGSVSSRKSNDNRYRIDEKYNSGSTINNSIQYNNTLNSIKSDNYNYPGLDAIIEHHLRPTAVYFDDHPPTIINSPRTPRFDASTTTSDDYDPQKQWSTTYTNSLTSTSPSSIRRHDGYIRPLTPEKISIRPNIHTYTESPVMYRSSKTVYTKDKQNYIDGGELRTWSVQKNDDIDKNKNLSTSIHVKPSIITNKHEYKSKVIEDDKDEYEVTYEYHPARPYDTEKPSLNQYFGNMNDDKYSSYSRLSTLSDREKNYNQSINSYKYTQENFNTRSPPMDNSNANLRHYTLKRTNSYDGLGIILSADADTRLNHRIRDVEPTSPGYQVGLRKNDRIISVNGINVENVEFNDVLKLIKQGLHNNNLKFSVINDSILV